MASTCVLSDREWRTWHGTDDGTPAIGMSSVPPCPIQGQARSRQGNWGWPHQSRHGPCGEGLGWGQGCRFKCGHDGCGLAQLRRGRHRQSSKRREGHEGPRNSRTLTGQRNRQKQKGGDRAHACCPPDAVFYTGPAPSSADRLFLLGRSPSAVLLHWTGPQ